jgi:hypothetical protein
VNLAHIMKQSKNGCIDPNWILLDNQSTVDVFYNRRLLRNIREADSWMDIHCNAGITSTYLQGDLPGYGTVWFHKDGIANILSLSKTAAKHHVTYGSRNGNEFRVHKADGTSRIFKQSIRGLFYMDTRTPATGTALAINTVDENKSRYSNRDYSRAVLARKLHQILGRPSTRDYIRIVETKQLPNCPIERDDIMTAEDIFGRDIRTLKGKTVRRGSQHIGLIRTDIPSTIMNRYKKVTIAGYIMKINKIPFMMTISRHIKFGTNEKLENMKKETLAQCIRNIRAVYMKRGFEITHILMDGQFETLCGDLAEMHITLNTVSSDEHVPEIERYIHTVKERVRCI